jgi:hypothetical protein
MAQWHAEFFEIGVGQFRQDFAPREKPPQIGRGQGYGANPLCTRVNPDKGKAIISHPTRPVEGGLTHRLCLWARCNS